jgi:hypothetical protein
MTLIARIQALLISPKTEWPVIAREAEPVASLFGSYVAMLAAIPAVCGLIGSVLVGAPVVPSFLFAVITYALTFLGVCVMALIIEGLAPIFDATKNFANALKLAVYFPTAFWLAGMFFALPVLSILCLLGLYSLYLLWIGLPVLMHVPQDKAAPYAASVGVGAIIVLAVIWTIAARVAGISLWV